MSKNVKSVKNSLKFKAQVKSGLISVRVGVKKYVVPVSVRILSSDSHMFLSFPATSELYKIKGKELTAMDPAADAAEALASLNPGKRRGRKRAAPINMPTELESALKAIPAGYKLVFDAAGKPRLAKARKRRTTK